MEENEKKKGLANTDDSGGDHADPNTILAEGREASVPDIERRADLVVQERAPGRPSRGVSPTSPQASNLPAENHGQAAGSGPSGSGLEPTLEECVALVTAVRRRTNWPPVHFEAGDVAVSEGEWVVVSTDHGVEVGQVVGRPIQLILPCDVTLQMIKRLASTQEIEQYFLNLQREKEARDVCVEGIGVLGLVMKLVQVESFFDGSKIVFSYFAENRVDFRELVRDLVRALRTRVEMRQIGVRHEAKMLGGIGSCGRQLCCSSFLTSFDPISIRMAKTQNLPLNPSKISGLCGRLLCCLTYEYETYLDIKRRLPSEGCVCRTPAGEGKVVGQNILRQTVTVALSDGVCLQVNAEDLTEDKMGWQVRARRKVEGPGVTEAGPETPTWSNSEKAQRVGERDQSEAAVGTAEAPEKRDHRQEEVAGGEKRPRSARRRSRGRKRSKHPEGQEAVAGRSERPHAEAGASGSTTKKRLGKKARSRNRQKFKGEVRNNSERKK